MDNPDIYTADINKDKKAENSITSRINADIAKDPSISIINVNKAKNSDIYTVNANRAKDLSISIVDTNRVKDLGIGKTSNTAYLSLFFLSKIYFFMIFSSELETMSFFLASWSSFSLLFFMILIKQGLFFYII